MATPFNRQLETFVCVFPHPRAKWVDARETKWEQWEFVYLFPPPDMLLWALKRLATFRRRALLISCLARDSYLWQEAGRYPIGWRRLLQPPGQWVLGSWAVHPGTNWAAALL